MFDKLKKLLEGGVAQVNPWDNGKTFQSVVNNRTPQQQNAVQQQQQQARVFNPARPQQAPQQNFTDKLRDILDANSQADKFRRAQEGQALDYRRQQQDEYGVKRPASTAQKRNVVQKAFDEVNPFDNGKSWNNAQPTTKKALWQQALDNPVINQAGAIVNAKIPGLGVSTGQIAAQVPSAVGQVGGVGYNFVNDAAKGTKKALNTAQLPFAKANIERDYKAGRLNQQQALDRFKAEYDQAGLEPIVVRDPNNPQNFRISSKIEEGTATPLEFGKQIGSVGIESGLEIAPMVSGMGLAPTKQLLAKTTDKLIAQGVNPTAQLVRSAVAKQIAGEGIKDIGLFGTAQLGKTAIDKNGQVGVSDVVDSYKNAAVNELMGLGFGNIVSGRGWGGNRIGGVIDTAVSRAAGNAVGRKVLPRSVAEITQEVATARQPVIANNAPRVTPDGTILPPRPASEIAAELAASKARAADPNVQAKMASIKAAGQPSTPVKKINMTPDDQRILADFNDIANGVYKPDAKLQRKIELDATYIAEKYNIPLRSTPQEMAEEFDNVLQRGVTKPEFAPKPQQYNQLAPKPSKQDPLEALKAPKGVYSTEDLYNTLTSQEASVPATMPKVLKQPTAFEQNTGVVAPTKKAMLELNTKRLNLTPEQTAQLDPKVKSVVDRMSNDDVVRIAKSAGLDTKSYSPGETRVKIAEQLNVRQDAVRLMNEAEVARKAGNTDQAAELLKQAAEQGRISRTQGTDLARQLQARRIIANELDTPQQKVFKLFDEAGVNPDVYTKRLAGVDFSDSKQVVNAYRELVPAKAGQWLDTVRYNSMLSSPLTQAVNIFGNAQNVAGVAPIEKTIRGGIDSIAGLFGKERQYAAGEGASYLKGEVKALPKAAKSFVDALKGSGEYANQDFSDYNMPLATKGAAGKAYQALSFPMRVLDGMDKFFRTLASSGEEAALDKRVSKGIGLRGDKQSLIDQEAAYRVYQAEGHIPGQGKVLDAMDSVADLVMSGRNSKNPILSTISKFTVPFVKTVNNINKQGFIEYSPAGLLNLVGKEDKIEGITKAVMGTAVFGTSALLLKSGDMTWAEPRNAEERARFRAEGKQPYAIKMGGKWYNYSKLTPVVAFPMAMTAALDDAFNKGKADQSFIDKTLTAFAKYGNFMSDQSYAKSIGDTLGAIGGDEEAIARMVSNQWQQVVPARALTGWLARMTDDVERKVDTTQGYFDQQVQAFMQQYPGLRQKTPTRDYQGQPIAANNPVLNAFSPVRVTNDRGVSPLDAEQDAIKLATAKAELLDKRQLKEVDNRSADKIREAQKQLISQPGWNELTAEEKKSGLSRLESDIKAVEKLQYQADNHVGEYSGSYTGKSTKLTANQKTLVNDGVRLSKYVGKSDSTEAKTNKEKYEKAFEDFNDPDNGYSRVEKVKKREELKRLTVQKDYDEDTTMLHGMSKEDVWGFLSTYEDGKAAADKLLALDDALTAAGVQDKNKFRDKYGNIAIKPKEKSSGKGGSKAKTVKGQAEAVSSERKLRALLANTNNKTSYRKPATQSAKVGLKKFAVKSAGITSRKGA